MARLDLLARQPCKRKPLAGSAPGLSSAATLLSCAAVLKGIEEAKAKGFKPHEVQEKARKLANEHLRVIIRRCLLCKDVTLCDNAI